MDLPPYHGFTGAITDDTQMSLFTAEGLIEATRRGTERGIWDPTGSVHLALLRWLETQGGPAYNGASNSGLITDPRLHKRRAPGLTCLDALETNRTIGRPAENDSKGCGTIMRVAPVALLMPREIVRKTAISCSALTHGHPTGQLAAAAWAEMLRAVAMGAKLEVIARDVTKTYAEMPMGQETASAIDRALHAPRDGQPETVEALGGGWVAEEALAIALYACLIGKGLEEGLRTAVTHSGDSDSAGAIAGNMLGLMYPGEVLAHRWTTRVECSDLIEGLVAELVAI